MSEKKDTTENEVISEIEAASDAVIASLVSGESEPSEKDELGADAEGDEALQQDKQKGEAEPENTEDDKAKTKADEGKDADGSDVEFSAELEEEFAKHPELKKRWQERMDGVDKLVNRNKEKEQQIDELLPVAEKAAEWGNRLQDPATAPQAFRQLAEELAVLHNTDVSAYLGSESAPVDVKSIGDLKGLPAFTESFSNAADADWFLAAIERTWPLLSGLIEKEVLAKHATDFDELRTARAERELEAKWSQYLDAYYPDVAARIAKDYKQFDVTRHMVREAVETFPQFTKEPVRAVEVHFGKSLKEHVSTKHAPASDVTEIEPDAKASKRDYEDIEEATDAVLSAYTD